MSKTNAIVFRNLLPFITLSFAVLISSCDFQKHPPLRLGTNSWLGYEPLYLARDLDYWLPEQLHLVEYLSSSETIRAFRNHEIDAAALTLDEILLLLQDGLDLQVILVTDISLGGDVILARPGITSIKDLAGKRVAVESTALGAYLLTRALEKHGLTAAEIEIVHQTANEHVYTFDNNVADAVVGCEPERSQLIKKGAIQIFDSAEIPGEIVDVIAVRKDFLQQSPNGIKALLEGWFKATSYLKHNPDDAAIRMGQRMQMQKEEIFTALKGIKFPTLSENLQMLGGDIPELTNAAKKLNQVMLANNLIAAEVSVDSLPISTPLDALAE